MAQFFSEETSGRLVAPLAAGLARLGVSPAVTAIVGFIAALASSGCVASRHYLAGFVFFALGRTLQAVSSIAAADSAAHIVAMNRTLSPIAIALMPFGFALADPARALAALFLLLGLLVSSASTRSPHVAGWRERNLEVVLFAAATVGIAAVCVAPSWFGIMAYGLGIFAFVQSGVSFASAFAEPDR